MIKIYTDGSCRGNGKANSSGGFGVAILKDDKLIYKYGEQCEGTTNNREELKAILHALELTQTRFKSEECYIYSDSAYCVNMCRDWIWTWHSRGWVRAKNQPIENLDLVQAIYSYLTIEFNNFTIWKVSGHAGEIGNEIADALATNNEAKLDKIFKENDVLPVKLNFFDF